MLARIRLLIVFLFALHYGLAQPGQKVMNVAIFVHEGVELFDFAGPGEVFVSAGRESKVIDFNVYTVAATEEEVTSQTFLRINPNYSIDNCPRPDILVLPGGATSIPLRDPKVIEWIKAVNGDAEIMLSVCTGAFLLGKAGLLEGLKATTHWGSIDGLRNRYPNTEVLEDTKFMDNGRIVTSGGVSSGTEGSLHVVSRLAGKATAEKVARYMEYSSWDNRLGLIEKEHPFLTAVRDNGFEATRKEMGTEGVHYGEMINLAQELLEKGEAKKALPVLEHLSKEYPFYEPYECLGQAYRQLGKDTPPEQTGLVELITAGKTEPALAWYADNKKQFPDWLLFDEATVNILGYQLMGKGKMEDAIEIFTLNTKEYPNSFNVWDSLAEAYLKSGDQEKAKKYYKKSLVLNPENTNAEKMLSSMD